MPKYLSKNPHRVKVRKLGTACPTLVPKIIPGTASTASAAKLVKSVKSLHS